MNDSFEYSQFLEPISEDAPCGINLEYDSQFLALEQLTKEKPEVQFGDTVQSAVGPEWREVYVQTLELLSKSKDIRLLVWLTQSGLNLHGINNFALSLGFIRLLLEKYWDNLHPQLDPDDDNDPTLRINILATLVDEEEILRTLRDIPLTKSRSYGNFSLRDIDIATGELIIEENQESPSVAVIEAALVDMGPEQFTQVYQALVQCREEITKIENFINEKVPVSASMSFLPLQKIIDRAYNFVHNVYQQNNITEGNSDDLYIEGENSSTNSKISSKGTIGINSTKDVIAAIDQICDYYSRTEPSSPVPNIIKRARNLVGGDFVSILKNVSPDSLENFLKISGETIEKESADE